MAVPHAQAQLKLKLKLKLRFKFNLKIVLHRDSNITEVEMLTVTWGPGAGYPQPGHACRENHTSVQAGANRQQGNAQGLGGGGDRGRCFAVCSGTKPGMLKWSRGQRTEDESIFNLCSALSVAVHL